MNFLENEKPTDYDLVLITDISVNEEVAEKLDLLYRGKVVDVALLDHHDTAKWLNDYDWSRVESNHHVLDTHKASGTSLMVSHFIHDVRTEVPNGIQIFAEQVRRYDTWEWFNFYKDSFPKQLNDLLYMLDRKTFIEEFTAIVASTEKLEDFSLTEKQTALLEQKQKEINAYIKAKNKQLVKWELDGYQVGILFAEQFFSELGNEICLQNKDIDYVIMIDPGSGKLSFRATKEGIHLGEIAKAYGGGGHPKASGAQVHAKIMELVLETYIKAPLYEEAGTDV